MIAVDTNVLVRFLVRDSVTPEHSDAAAAEFRRAREAGDRVFIPIVALLETVWVLGSRMKAPKVDVLDMLAALLAESFITVDRHGAVLRAAARWRTGPAGFADYLALSLANDEGATELLTFDGKLLREAGTREPAA